MRRYQLDEFVAIGDPIGSGAYGMVTKVMHKSTAETFAMKTITKKKVLEHKMTSYLMREVKTQIKIHHPNILRLVYYFEDAQSVFLLLELARGGSLFSVLRNLCNLPEHEAARIFADVASALDHLHRNGIIHRDLKPENVLMCEGNIAKLADFGWCAELSKDCGVRHTFCGTWDYLSPEMINNEPHDFTVDIWAIGVLLFEILTGRPPFAASNQMKAMTRITRVDLQIPDSVSSGAGNIIGQLLVKEPKRRLSLADAVRHHWVTRYVPNADQKVKRPASAAEAAGSPQARGRSPPPMHAPLPSPGAAVTTAHGEAAAAPAAVARQEGLGAGSSGAVTGMNEPPAPPQNAEVHPAGHHPFAKELAHLPSPGDSLSSSLAPIGDMPPLGGLLENMSQKQVLPVASTLAAGPSAIKPHRLNELIKKRLDTGAPSSIHDTGAPSSASASAGIVSSACPLAAGADSPAQADPEQSLAVIAPEALGAMAKDSPCGLQWSPDGSAPSPGSEEGKGRKELWQQTDTFAAICKFVRKKSAVITPSGEELDKTLPVTSIQAVSGEEDRLAMSEGSANHFSIPVTRSDQLAPLPKQRAATSSRRTHCIDLSPPATVQLGTGSGPPMGGSAHHDGGVVRGAFYDQHGGASSSLPPGAGVAKAALHSAPPIAVLASSLQTVPLSPLLEQDTPRLQEVRDFASRMQDLRSQIERDLDSSCSALKQHFDQWECGNQDPPWKEIEQAPGLLEKEVAGCMTEAAAADRAAGVAAVGADSLPDTQ